jgi:hypothetical protein
MKPEDCILFPRQGSLLHYPEKKYLMPPNADPGKDCLLSVGGLAV